MGEATLYIAAVLLLLGVSALLLCGRRGGTVREPGAGSAAEFFPVHSRYYTQLRRALCLEDTQFLAGRASPEVFRRWKQSQRRAVCRYLEGLREDFQRLNRLARLLALRSPKVRPRQELELAWLSLEFELLYGIVWFRLWLGRPVETSLGQMATLIGSLGSRLEQASLGLNAVAGGITP